MILLSIGIAYASVVTPPRATNESARPAIVYAHHSAPGSGDVAQLFNVTERPLAGLVQVRAREDAQYVRISTAFAKPVRLSRVIVESCVDELADGAEFFFHPGYRRQYLDVANKTLNAMLKTEEEAVTSFSVHFRHQAAPCLKAIRFLDITGNEITFDRGAIEAFPSEEKAKAIREAFASAELAGVLDHELAQEDEKNGWLVRLRGDGTYFLLGRVDEVKKAGSFNSSGVFEVTEQAPGKITLRLRGERISSAIAWDGWRCGSPCGERAGGRAQATTDLLVVEKGKKGRYMVRNRTPSRQRSLPFSDLTTKISTLAE